MTSDNRNPPILLRLPLEIRLKIYDLLLINRSTTPQPALIPITFSAKTWNCSPLQGCHSPVSRLRKQILHSSDNSDLSTGPLPRFTFTRPGALHPNLLYVCRQIHIEALQVLYGANVFDLSGSASAAKAFLSSLSPRARGAIRKIRLGRYGDSADQEWAIACGYVAASLPNLRLLCIVASGSMQSLQAEWVKELTAIRGLDSLCLRSGWALSGDTKRVLQETIERGNGSQECICHRNISKLEKLRLRSRAEPVLSVVTVGGSLRHLLLRCT